MPDLHGGAVGRQRDADQAGVLVQGRAGAGAQGLRRQVVQHQGHQDLRGVQAGRAEPPRHPAACPEHPAARSPQSRRREHAQIRSLQVINSSSSIALIIRNSELYLQQASL